MGFASAVTNHSSALLLMSSLESTLDLSSLTEHVCSSWAEAVCLMDATAAYQLLIIIADLAVSKLVLRRDLSPQSHPQPCFSCFF